ncbi:MAG: uridine diphosphate-N-acetylglucosamine-binding protein YvcK [Nitriliruptoraceae bacterium]
MSRSARVLERAAALGGGHGVARSLAALTRLAEDVVAVVTVADDGGSSGRLRRDFGGLPPGDLRMALTALAGRSRIAEVLGHRFARGELAGHSLGNLVLTALVEEHDGDVIGALDELASWLAVPGRVLPCTTEPLSLHATTAHGQVDGQAAITRTSGLQRLRVAPAAPEATPQAVDAITRAELLVIGPGSLYTSVLPNLLVPGIRDALIAASAPVVLVANLREQPGETEGMTLADHLDVLASHVPGLYLDALVVHEGPPPGGPGRPLGSAVSGLEDRVGRLVRADLKDANDGHDPEALARALRRLLVA